MTLSEDTIGSNLLPGGVDISDTSDAGTGTITDGDDAAELSIEPTASATEGFGGGVRGEPERRVDRRR